MALMALTLSDLSLLSRLFDDGLALPAAQREAWLSALQPDARHLAPRLRRMLDGHDRHTDALAELPLLEAGEAAQAGERVGPWCLVREIGRGGMGSVWLAERADGTYERQVALKLPRIAWAENLARRMARERRIVALLEHPAIARLYDAGLDERGRPYLAMEVVDGLPIDRFCRQRAAPPRETVALLLQVVRAVAYAHGRLVVHRDIKPGNVLVTPDGQAHLLDFGIAALLDDQPAEARLTQEQGRSATLLYASPEQLRGEPATVQADVYSLGVLLHELLCGTVPEAGVVSKALRGELAAVVGKALQEDPSRRYGSADALAADLQRWLDGEPVRARPEPLPYRLARLVRRHRWAATSGLLVTLALLAGGGLALLQSMRAAEAAQREQAMKAFVAEVFRLPAPQPAAPGELTAAPAEAFLERSALLVAQYLRGQPRLQADLYAMMGRSFADMGAYRMAAAFARHRLEALALPSADDAERARARMQLAEALLHQAAMEPARDEAQAALRLGAGEPALRREARMLLARVLAAGNAPKEAAELLHSVEADRAPGAEAVERGPWLLGIKGWLAFRRGEIDQALPLLDQAIERARAQQGPSSAAYVELNLAAANALATTLRRAETERYFNAAIGALEQQGGLHGVRAALLNAEFSAYRFRASRQVTAEEVLAAVARARAALGAGGRALPIEIGARLDRAEAMTQIDTGRVATGLPLMRRAMSVLFADAGSIAEKRSMVVTLAYALRDSGDHAAADTLLRDALQLRSQVLGADHPYAALDLGNIVENLSMAGRTAEALAMLDAAPAYREARGDGARHPQRMQLRLLLNRSRVLLDSGDAAGALAVFPPPLLEEPADRSDALPVLGEAQCLGPSPAEGLPLLQAALAATRESGEWEHSPSMVRLQSIMGSCALRLGQRPLAARAAQAARQALQAQPGTSAYFSAPLLRLEAALGQRR